MKQSKKLLTNKILFSGLLILIQLIIVFVAFLTIHRSSRFFVYLFKLISVLAALYIINKDDASAYKITWLVLIAAVPFVGGVLYVFLGDKKPSQRLQFAFLKKIKDGKWYEAGAEIGNQLNESLRKIPWTKIKETAGNIGKGIAEFINGGIENIDWNLVGSTLGEGLNTAIIFLKKFVTTLNFASIVDAIFNFLVGTISTINWGDIAYIIFYMIGVNFGVQVRQLWNVISIACSSIGTFFHNKIAEAGGNVALGLWNGILEGLGNIAKWLYDNVIYPFIDGFKNGMGIHSPSTVMFELRKICNARAFEPE